MNGAWKKYLNTSGKSNVLAYKIGSDYIKVIFSGNVKTNSSYTLYTYDSNKPGKPYVEEMKNFAKAGSELNGFINREIKKNYADKNLDQNAILEILREIF